MPRLLSLVLLVQRLFATFGVQLSLLPASWRGAISQSGRLSAGSLLTSVFRPSISAPSLRGLPVLRRSAHQSLLAQVSKMRHTGTQSHQTSGAVSVANVGALTPNSIQFGGISSTVAPCVGLTYWSRGRLYFRSLRQSHAGAPYRGR